MFHLDSNRLVLSQFKKMCVMLPRLTFSRSLSDLQVRFKIRFLTLLKIKVYLFVCICFPSTCLSLTNLTQLLPSACLHEDDIIREVKAWKLDICADCIHTFIKVFGGCEERSFSSSQKTNPPTTHSSLQHLSVSYYD